MKYPNKSNTIEKAMLALLDGKWVRRADIFDLMRNRCSYKLVQDHLSRMFADGVIWRRLDANEYKMEPVYTLARDATATVIPNRARSEGVSCPCCGALRPLR